ncbi:MAG: EamA/RhaT family transporter [Deltaproteobacteria bacterium]|nr:MAG: EamA/RhaT family transporter [Deltaproteobacteria bacterium]TMQ21780.1 MAG: EamA/RhaT family transporter [Deltaproteobacteria bacterium]
MENTRAGCQTRPVRRSPVATGVALAAAAAVAFGVATPIVAWAGRAVGPLSTAALLYLGAALTALVLQLAVRRHEAAVRRSDAPRLIAIAIAGGALAPALLAWGLQHAGPTAGALLLNLEAVFTVLLARALFHEPIGRRVAVAVACMAAGGAALALDAARGGGVGWLGVLAVAGATAAWALDNALTRPLAERDPFQVILVKGVLGASLTAIVAIARGEPLPPLDRAAVLVGCGATGYGASLYLYLLAQRRIGAGRTGSVFALAPFLGAALAWSLGDRHAGGFAIGATALFAAGVVLHVGERHGHRHVHRPVEHEHMHRHDDGHHTHAHDPPFLGEHAHPHRHEQLEHDHEHAPDVHHSHEHA